MHETLNETLWKNIALAYDLGAWDTLPQAVTGGLKHRLYRARTARGEYAVKVLNPRLLRGMGRLARYKRAEQIAQEAAQAGLPAVCALPGPDGPVQAAGSATVMVFPWLSGTILPPGPASPDAARQMGILLGRLHALAPDIPALEPPSPLHFSDAYWARLVRQGREDGLAWADTVGDALPDLKRWSAATRRAREALGAGWTATHRDMDQKNVLWSGPDTPHLLDWEEAGAMSPTLEVMGTALNWAGQSAGPPDAETFAAFVEGYRSAAPLDPVALRPAAVAVLDKWLVWLDFNLQRSLCVARTPPEEQAAACGAASHALATLHSLAEDTPRRLAWCDALAASSPRLQPADRRTPHLPEGRAVTVQARLHFTGANDAA